MSSLTERLLKNSTSKHASLLEDSKLFSERDMVPTDVPIINTALSGSITGGLSPGVTMLAGPSKHFKSGFALLMARSYIRHYKDSVILFYDSEFGTPQSYFDNFGIPQNRVVHTPITDIEELRHDLSVQIDNITRTDKVIIVIDSLGNLASRKEVTDALEGNEKSDMTRAKVIKSMFRIITPKLTLKNIPLVVINHTYKEMGMFPKDIVSGGTGSYLAADNIWVLGRRQDKDGNEISGYDFIINIEKSRYVREKSKIPITISYDGGINKWSGLLDLAIEAGYIVSPTKGWYSTVDKNTGEVGTQKMRAGDIEDSDDFWKKMFSETDFAAWIENKYKLANGRIISDGEEE